MFTKAVLTTLLVGLCGTCLALKLPAKPILVTDVDHNDSVTQNSINNGADYILVKQNSAKLDPKDTVFYTTKNSIYSTAHVEDLVAPNALKNLLIGQVTPLGDIKVLTLANLGYHKVQVVDKGKGTKEIFLTKLNGQTDKVFMINYRAELPPIKAREEENEKVLAEQPKKTQHKT